MSEYIYAFIVGGGFCIVGQILMDVTKLTTPRVLVLLVLVGVIMQALNIYEPIVELAGAGAKVPLPGFGYSLAKGAMEGASQGLLEAIIGALKSTSAGITVAIGWGYFIALIFSPKSLR